MLRTFLVVIFLISGTFAQARNNAPKNDRPFDYYVLALSWSPTYCASKRGSRDRTQCGNGRRFAFVVHGLWPQHVRGWPQYCQTNQRWVGRRQIKRMLDIMPSKRLIIHEWKKHGTCSRLGQKAYFKLTRKLFDKVLTPARYLSPSRPILIAPENLVSDFIKTNRGLDANALSVQCGNSRNQARLSELRICFSKSGEFTDCGQNERRRCHAQTLILPPVR